MGRLVRSCLLILLPSAALAAQGVPVYTSSSPHPTTGGTCSGTRVQIHPTSGQPMCCVSSHWAQCGGAGLDSQNATTVVASGSVTPRSLADRFSEVVNVKDFGAQGDGTTDDTTAIQSAMNAAASPGAGVVFFPATWAYYKITSPIKVPHHVSVRGNLRTSFISSYVQDVPRIHKSTTTTVGVPKFEDGTIVQRDAIFYMDPAWIGSGSGGAPNGYYPQDFEIAGLSIRGADATSTIAVYFEQGSGLNIHDSDISGVKYALYARNIWSSSFDRVKSTARWDVEVGGTSLKFERVASGGSSAGFDGFHLVGVTYSSFVNTTSDGYNQSAYEFTNCRGVTMIGVGAEAGNAAASNTGSMFRFNGSNVITVVGAFSVTKTGSTYPVISAGNGDIITFIGADFHTHQGTDTAIDLYVVPTARVSFQNCQFLDSSNNHPVVTFSGTGSVVPVYYDGNWIRIVSTGTEQNSMPQDSVFRASAGTNAFNMTSGARINLGSALILQGSSDPEGATTAGVGSLYLRTSGGASTTLYVKTSGTGNTGWTAK